MEHDIPFGNSNRENKPTFLDFPLFLGIFQWDEPTKRVPFTAEPEVPEILTKWKAPQIFLSMGLRHNVGKDNLTYVLVSCSAFKWRFQTLETDTPRLNKNAEYDTKNIL